MNIGDIPNLFQQEEFIEQIESMKKIAKHENINISTWTFIDFYDLFIEKIKQNLHIVLFVSPIGNLLRSSISQFPSFVNCCTINWFTSWPLAALQTTGKKLTKDLYLDNYTWDNLVNSFSDIHQSALNFAQQLRENEGSHFYITPTLFLEMI